MAEALTTRVSRGHRTLCLPISEECYRQIIDHPQEFRRMLDECYQRMPELFPRDFVHGYKLKDGRVSSKQDLPIRRIVLRDGTAYSIRPSFLMPYMTARTEDVEGPLFLRKFGVPYWALTHVFGRDPMSWYRLECAWAAPASWGRPSARWSCLSICWPMSTTRRVMGRRRPSPRPWPRGAAWEPNRHRRRGPMT